MAAGMSYENLTRLQEAAQMVFAICLFGGVLFFLLGLIKPNWVGFAKRRWVVLTTLAVWLFGAVTYGGAIAYTHSQPNGPHAFQSYMDGFVAKICIQNPAHHSCPELKQKCATGDATHPSCRILAGEDPSRFYSPQKPDATP